MKKQNVKVDLYLQEGCGRCALGGTPECKVHTFPRELKELRKIILQTELIEEVKWSVPCYTYLNKNILILSAFKEYCAIGFFKGVLLKDQHKLLIKAGENSQSSMSMRFTNLKEIIDLKKIIIEYIEEAIKIEKAGHKVEFKKITEHPIPDELQKKWEELPKFKEAFQSLTPGRQRGYLIYFSSPKQSQTRETRILKYISKIMEGKGIND
jgi:uncharacterized protein YdeI (YjbR/CyaY-like superfamily)